MGCSCGPGTRGATAESSRSWAKAIHHNFTESMVDMTCRQRCSLRWQHAACALALAQVSKFKWQVHA